MGKVALGFHALGLGFASVVGFKVNGFQLGSKKSLG